MDTNLFSINYTKIDVIEGTIQLVDVIYAKIYFIGLTPEKRSQGIGTDEMDSQLSCEDLDPTPWQKSEGVAPNGVAISKFLPHLCRRFRAYCG